MQKIIVSLNFRKSVVDAGITRKKDFSHYERVHSGPEMIASTRIIKN